MTASDTAKAPLKWQKYLMLVQFGFVTQERLEVDIHRYPRSQAARLVREIDDDLRRVDAGTHRSLYVVKLVSRDLQGQLPNYRVEHKRDLKGIQPFLELYDAGRYIEIWFCRTRIDASVFSVAGRIVFANGDSARTQTIEQLWRCSPRLIERFGGDLPCPYARASRYGWGWRYGVEQLQMPPGSRSTRSELEQDLWHSLQVIERSRERIEAFLAFLDSFSFGAYSIEYKIVGSTLEIIDWDTPNDRRVLLESCASFV